MDGATLTTSAFLDPDALPEQTWTIAVTRDFNKDGKTDILWRDTAGQLVVWYMDGGVLTTGAATNPPVLDPSWLLVGPR